MLLAVRALEDHRVALLGGDRVPLEVEVLHAGRVERLPLELLLRLHRRGRESDEGTDRERQGARPEDLLHQHLLRSLSRRAAGRAPEAGPRRGGLHHYVLCRCRNGSKAGLKTPAMPTPSRRSPA